MRLSVFIDYQNNSSDPYMCYNKEHEMRLVPFVNNDLEIELKCFFPQCGFSIKPGLITYKKIIEKNLNV